MPAENPGALLTKTQRSFLDGESDVRPDDSRGRVTRTRIRERVHAGLQDIAYLAEPELFAERDVDQLREKLRTDQGLADTLAEVVAFVYRLAPERFESIIDTGARWGVERVTPEYTVGEVSIPIRRSGWLLEQARRRMANDDPLTDRQVRILLEQGEVPADELRTYARSHPIAASEEYTRRFRDA